MRVAEVFHGRLAMLGVAGALAPEILGKGAWFELGDASKALPSSQAGSKLFSDSSPAPITLN